jgi:hypothetical protein
MSLHWLKVTTNAWVGNRTYYAVHTSETTQGKPYELTFTYFIPSTNALVNGIVVRDQSGAGTIIGQGAALRVLDVETTVTLSYTATDHNSIMFHAEYWGGDTFEDAAGGNIFYIKNIVIREIGALYAFEPEGIGAGAWKNSNTSNLFQIDYPDSGSELARMSREIFPKALTLPYIADGSVLGINTAGFVQAYQAFPWMVNVNVFTTPGSQVRWNAITITAGLLYGAYLLSDAPGAVDAEVTWPVYLSKGTWTFTLTHYKHVSVGQYEVSIDGTVVGTIEGYNAGGAWPNFLSAITGIVISNNAKVTLKLRMHTKNAASAAYYGAIQGINFIRTA